MEGVCNAVADTPGAGGYFLFLGILPFPFSLKSVLLSLYYLFPLLLCFHVGLISEASFFSSFMVNQLGVCTLSFYLSFLPLCYVRRFTVSNYQLAQITYLLRHVLHCREKESGPKCLQTTDATPPRSSYRKHGQCPRDPDWAVGNAL